MTPRQKLMVQQGFADVAPIADVAARLFYARLFELNPSLEHGLGDAFTLEVRDAWAAVYTVLADTMQQGAAEAGRAAA